MSDSKIIDHDSKLSNLLLSIFSISEFFWDFNEEGVDKGLLFDFRIQSEPKHEVAMKIIYVKQRIVGLFMSSKQTIVRNLPSERMN